MEIILVTADSTRDVLEQAIVAMRDKQRRMPAHWTKRREELGDEIDRLVGYWLAAEA